MDKKAVEAVKLFAEKAGKEFHLERIILFGSRARDDYSDNSDIDLIILSKDFEAMDFISRANAVRKYWESGYKVDFFCYPPEQFKDVISKYSSIGMAAAREGAAI